MSELRWIGRLHSGAQDAVEQVGNDGTIGERRNRAARPGQIGISLRIEHRTDAARCGHPPCKAFGWHSLDVTHQIAAGERHCRLAVGRDYLDAAPVRGVRRGGGREQLEVAVTLIPGAVQQ